MKSLRRQLTRELLVSLAVLLGLALLALYGAIWVELNRAFNSTLEARALGISALVEQDGGRLKLDFSERILRGFAAGKKARAYFELRDEAGNLITRSTSLGDGRLEVPTGKAGESPDFWNLTLPNGRDGRGVRLLFRTKGETEKSAETVPAVLVVAVSREDLDEVLGGLFAAVAGTGVLLLAGVFFVVPRVLRRGLAPVDRLGEQVADIHADSLTARFDAASLPAELQPIGERLNDLLARLETSFERERRFSADLAHELRTPLAELRSLAECALKWPDSRDPATDRDTLAIALQMEALVTRLLTLARGERGQLAAQSEPVDLAALVAASWQSFATRAADRGLRFRAQVPTGTVAADPVLLRSILANLFDNAVDYAPAGGEIVVTGESGGGLRVANPAGNLAAGDVERFFERFWRKEAARTGGLHAGLGLNLARVFATAMGWRLTVTLEEGWLVFRLVPGAE